MGGVITKETDSVSMSLFKNNMSKPSFLIDRTLIANCDFLPPRFGESNIVVGIFGRGKDPENPLGHQGIRLGNSEILPLKNCIQNSESIQYEFGDNTSLHIFKRKEDVCYNLKTNDLNITRCIDPLLCKNFKTIGMNSDELDKIADIMK